MREDDAALRPVDLQHLQGNRLSDKPFEPAAFRLREIDVRPGDEAAHAQTDDQPPFDLIHHHGVEALAGLLGLLHTPPGHLEIRAALGEDDGAFIALDPYDADVDAIAARPNVSLRFAGQLRSADDTL